MSLKMVPSSRPAWPPVRVAQILADAGITSPVALLGVRAYYRDTMGKPGVNDLGIYDDAIFLQTPTSLVTFNANVDPAKSGVNPKIGKPFAVLKSGRWLYRLGLHKQSYTALIQAEAVTVLRPGGTPSEETGWFGINIHRGGYGTVSSEGCQTIYPDQWPEFISLVQSAMNRAQVKTLPYLLMEEQG